MLAIRLPTALSCRNSWGLRRQVSTPSSGPWLTRYAVSTVWGLPWDVGGLTRPLLGDETKVYKLSNSAKLGGKKWSQLLL